MMEKLIQLVYCSTAQGDFSRDNVLELLRVARRKNADRNVTGMLLFAKGSFFQVLEGGQESVEEIFSAIKKDTRHMAVTVIIKEPIARRTFGDWTMGYADLSPEEIDEITGTNDFFIREDLTSDVQKERVEKLLEAFREGRWRAKIRGKDPVQTGNNTFQCLDFFPKAKVPRPDANPGYSFAFQPIVRISDRSIHSYEALLRTLGNGPPSEVLDNLTGAERKDFFEQNSLHALNLAAANGLCCHINLNIMPSTFTDSSSAIESIVKEAQKLSIRPKQIILEILESEIIESPGNFSESMRDYRSTGVQFAIDDFGAGYAGLNLLAEFQPDLLKLDLALVRNVDSKGPRQAIIRGIMRTCFDLGIDVLAEGVETPAEYRWLRDEGVDLFQGYLFARPSFQKLETSFGSPV